MTSLVLIVEDNDKNRKLARDVLELGGFATIEAADGSSGLRLAREQHPAVILMDIQLPDMPGDDVLARLRDDPTTSDIPVVAVTAYAMAHDRDRLIAAGFDGYISKPIDVRRFTQQVGSYCGDGDHGGHDGDGRATG